MELWIEHTAPAFATKEATFLKQSLVSWYQAMHAHGLASDITELERFITKGIE